MSKVKIIIPVEDYDEALHYYSDVLLFTFKEGEFYLPVDDSNICLRLRIIDEEARKSFSTKKRSPIFGFAVENNFLSYLKTINANGALIEMACATPGGYYACIADPAGNRFEIECENFEEIGDAPVDTSEWLFFHSY